MEEKIRHLLASLVHPETGQDIVSSGFIEHIASAAGKITVVLRFAKARDPFAVKIKNQAEELLKREFPDQTVLVVIKEGGAAPRPEPKLKTTTGGIAKVIAVASGKGGVGKSTVTANLAVALRNMGFRVGILDADIYGPSQPKMFGVEGYLPDAVQEEGADHIVPAESMDIRLMSIGFFIKPTDALLWRGAMAVSALKQMIHQTKWGTLDFLLADLPPGTGDVHLSIIGGAEDRFRGDRLDAPAGRRGRRRARRGDVPQRKRQHSRGGNHRKHGLVHPRGTARKPLLPLRQRRCTPVRRRARRGFPGEIPIVQSIMEGSDEGRPAAGIDPRVEKWYCGIAEKIVEKVMKSC